MDIQDRIRKVGTYFKGMQVTKVDDTDVIYVIVSFPEKWIIDDEVTEKFNVNVLDGKEVGELYFCTEMEVGFDKVFDAIDHCIAMNKEAMERTQLFQKKIAELKEIFGDGTNTIAELRTLEFTFPPQKKGIRKKKSQIDEIAEKEIANDNNIEKSS